MSNRSIMERKKRWMTNRIRNYRWSRGPQMRVTLDWTLRSIYSVFCTAITSLVFILQRNRWRSFVKLMISINLQHCNLHVTLSPAALRDQKVMAGEALERRNIWQPSVYYALGKESFYIAGHDISIRESMDTYGALIWPGVCTATVCICTFSDLLCCCKCDNENLFCRR